MILGGAALEAPPRIVNHLAMHVQRRLCLIPSLAFLLAVAACEGDVEDTTPAGSQGPQGEAGASGQGPLETEPEIFGLVGRVTEANGALVTGGKVYLVPASDVEALSLTPIDLFASPEVTASLGNDEPIEDLIDDRGGTYEQASVDENGEYRFETLPEGSHFVVWFPPSEDTQHLPGGDYGLVAFSSDALIGMQMDIRVSSQPSPAATFVGSSTCMACHGFNSTTATAHNVGLQVPGVRSPLQDITPWPNFDDGLDAFDAGTTLYYFDCDVAAEGPSKCAVSDSPPLGTVSFELRLRRDAGVPLGTVGAYFVELVNSLNIESARRYDVVLTYGGAIWKQQYLMRRSNASGTFSYFVLPLQYNYQGDYSNPSPADWPWRDYRSDQWFDFGSEMLTQPASSESFDNNCAGCHMTGFRIAGGDSDGWSASAVVDSAGAIDYDGDGRLELINTGCEACHGPGSEHVALSPLGGKIVSPELLTPGRAAMICGSCHSRPIGIGGGMKGLPLSAANQMPPPGIRRADFAVDNTTRVGGTPEDFFKSGDPAAHYQQYSDHLQARHYRNPKRMSTCTGCHDPHASFANVYGLEVQDNLNVVCTVCHSEVIPVIEHVDRTTGFTHSTINREFQCTECHMVPTAASGAATPALLDSIPSGAPTVQYYWNDISSHRMVMTGRAAYAEQPVAATNQCGVCHGGFFPNQ
jgi:predicted CXXCH cytochrome family protein